MTVKISIIVPTYNVEKYISKCLDSLVNQDYPNFDVVVVNDGSPFNEQKIIDKYVLKYPQLVKSIIKENGGYGSALETGFRYSDADYVLICDPDDYLEKNALSVLANNLEATGAELSIGAKNLIYSDNDMIEYHKSYNSDFGLIESGKQYVKGQEGFEMFYFVDPSPHSKLYKRSVVLGIEFPHKCSYADNLLYFYSLNKANNVVYSNDALSYYLINRIGNTSTDIKPKVIDDHIKVFKEIMRQVNNPEPVFFFRMYEFFLSIYYRIDDISGGESVKREKYEELFELLTMLTEYSDKIMKYEDIYHINSMVMRKQKEKLLNKKTSKREYNLLIENRIKPNLINKLKLKVLG